jgi:apolipoprotein N-acyltransferase
MQNAVSTVTRVHSGWKPAVISRARIEAPTITEWCAAVSTSLLLILSFPNFDLYPLTWLGLVPLLVVIAKRPAPARAFILGWVAGTVFFYGSCYWLTYSMIHYGGLSTWLAYLLLVPGALIVGLFPAVFAMILALTIKRWGYAAVLLAPFLWTSLEWSRLGITGQLWNAIGYSQAYQPFLIRSARWGGVYAVSFLIVTVNAALAFAVLKKTPRAVLSALSIILLIGSLATLGFYVSRSRGNSSASPFLYVVALQPNVPMTPVKTVEETQQLLSRHLSMRTVALWVFPSDNVPRLVVWPESPMNFSYASDKRFQDVVAKFTINNHTSLLFNSLEPAPGGGGYNSAVLVNEEGRPISQYDKIRLLPFGEYVPLPHWIPGASLITAIVGDFTPGEKYTLMPLGNHRAGVFICIESAYPSIARNFTSEGADFLINISNDGYLGPTAVMRQHLANAIFRAVENGRLVLRITNSGITASIRANGLVEEETSGFQPAVATWKVSPSFAADTFYTRHGDLFALVCTIIAAIVFAMVLFNRRRSLQTQDE